MNDRLLILLMGIVLSTDRQVAKGTIDRSPVLTVRAVVRVCGLLKGLLLRNKCETLRNHTKQI